MPLLHQNSNLKSNDKLSILTASHKRSQYYSPVIYQLSVAIYNNIIIHNYSENTNNTTMTK